MKSKDQVATTMNPGWPALNRDGDRRDVHDHNPADGLKEAHERGISTPKNIFQEVSPTGPRRGPVTKMTPDILSSPMNGPRCGATGERESELGKNKNVT